MTDQQFIVDTHMTEVSVRLTMVRYYIDEVKEVVEEKITGRLNIQQSREYAKAKGGVYISKENFLETFLVNTIALIQLKEPNTSVESAEEFSGILTRDGWVG